MSSQPANTNEDRNDTPFMEDFLRDIQLQGHADDTIRSYRSSLGNFFEWYQADPRDLDRDDLKDFLYHLKHERVGNDGTTGVSTSTINNYFSCLNTYFRFLKYEDYIDRNPVPEFRERYVQSTSNTGEQSLQLISVEEMSMLAHATLNVRNRAIIVTLAKTGVRRGELVRMDVEDINWEEQSIRLKDTAKRDNLTVFFDGECGRVLKRWLQARDEQEPTTEALFTNQYGTRLKRNGIYEAVTKPAASVGLHDPDSSDKKERFTPHCCRHWFTTHLRRSGMEREFIQELRGDNRGEAIDIYDHIDRKELREAYLAHIPSLGL